MENESILIDWRLFDPRQPSLFGSKNDKARFTTLHCSNSENCGAFAVGKCAVWHGLGGQRCPYGQRRAEVGFTKRARKCGAWVSERRKKVEGIEQLDPMEKIARIGDYVCFPYPHWANNLQVDDKYKTGFLKSGSKFLPAEMFTIDLFEKIINARPRAMMGGEITSYQREVVPQIIMETEEELPKFFAAWVVKYPSTAKRFLIRDYVGREAYLHSVVPGSIFPHKKGRMLWTGEELIIEKMKLSVMDPIWRNYEKAKLIVVPTPEATVKITDNSQVDANARFA